MGRNSKRILYLIILVGCAAFILFVIKDINQPKVYEKVNERSFIEGFSFKSNLDSDSFYRINAKKAVLIFEEESINFDNCTFYYKDPSKEVKGSSKKCRFEKDRSVILEEGIQGFYNTVELKGGEKSRFHYDLVKYEGEMIGGVFAKDGLNSIKSEKMKFSKGDAFVEFLGRVEVMYVW